MIQHIRQWWTAHLIWIYALVDFLSPSLQQWTRDHPKTILAGLIPLLITAILTRAPLDRKINPAIALLLLPTLFLAGYTPLEQTAYKTVVGSSAFIKSVASRHPECTVAGNTVEL
jgi:hypothetical protein